MRLVNLALMAAAACALAAGGCKAKPLGQIMLAVQTDLSLPKDIDAIRIEAFTEGVPKLRNDYDRMGPGDGEIHLPGTIGLIAPENADDAVRIIVSARSGGRDGEVKILREIVTTVPVDRVVTLQLPLEFLCSGQAKILSGEATSTCPEGKSCVAGTCVDKQLDSQKLPTYTEDGIFGDGGCFDSTNCWGTPTVAALDMATCTIPNAEGINVALQTEGEGICGPVGCFVTLDADSDTGWKVNEEGRIALPQGVCDQVTSGKIVNVVTTPIATGCGQKSTSLPTCGPWSAAKIQPAAYTGAIALAGGQPLPVALSLTSGGVVWTNAGLSGAQGAVKAVASAGGVPEQLTSASTAPRALVASGDTIYWTDAPGAAGMGAIFRLQDGTPTAIVNGLDVPEGIALAANKLFWSDFQSGGIFSAGLDGAGSKQIATGNYPYRLVADDTYVYWTNEGTAMAQTPDGSLARVSHKSGTATVETFATGQQTPRALALEAGTNGATTAVWWVSFAAKGTVMRSVVQADGSLGAPEEMAQNLGYPNGIAVDAANVYWTNRGDGTVMSLPLSAKAGDAPKTLASGQKAPGAVVTDANAIYWLSEGGSSDPSGAVVRLPKAQ
ncbi:Putative serine/threonine-protein kinase pknH [Minicystis rosea]|nr:Putative serine/threonine-protein kinase pknH [Minicystis rosea]